MGTTNTMAPENIDSSAATTTDATTGEQTQTPTVEDLQKRLNSVQKSAKDTQAAYTRGQQRLKALEAENKLLKEGVNTLSASEKDTLEELKYSNPEAWRLKINELEIARNNKLAEARTQAELDFELERRAEILNRPEYSHITDEVIENDIPPRITNKLKNNKISFEDFLAEATEYLSKGKTVANPETMGQPSLGKAAGGTTPDKQKVEKSIAETWESITL